MINPFQNLMEDIFLDKNFIQFCYINNKKIPCLVSSISCSQIYTQWGFDIGVDFDLQIKKAEYLPKKNDKILYKNVQYKVDSFVLDSTGLTHRITLKK